ncbi:hypothetical protein [Leuconostoc pseudomesenteroides]|uniref:DUF1642 domain-containing protein n=1 Tax=Leuconostoc pseudomesenteroides TaxID=33968 RepID=A0ABT6HBJ6_LEUPS|nr:hypothetical protein [Leuconostoc pseudomesenteroides]MDG9733463.1 hypothetical protein [Leuconostoc pseudomesenteroides]NKZ36095.1 hypothetical protein [Leuconostoc pseudomesenteroides]QQB28446.1 hypothetical protein I6H60_06375 [Leuconostoc pseudomesenteroides]QQB28447.1 hypothetical protein I6H60_06640 [Leuconostoc pseudomesenteroides]
MTEPVAYVQIKDGKAYSVLRKGTPNDEYTPVYTAEQLRPRVKMTQAEFDDWHELYECNTLFSSAMALLDDDEEVEKYHNIFMKIYKGKDELNIKNEVVFAKLWSDYNPENPEETIDIVPDMKWFVRRILPNTGGNMLYCTDDGELTYNYNKEYATQFDTKEEAEKWTNPLTEAVKLPVEGE